MTETFTGVVCGPREDRIEYVTAELFNTVVYQRDTLLKALIEAKKFHDSEGAPNQDGLFDLINGALLLNTPAPKGKMVTPPEEVHDASPISLAEARRRIEGSLPRHDPVED